MSNANLASASFFARARAAEAALTGAAVFKALLGLFGVAVFLAEAAFASLFAAVRVRDTLAAPELFRFRFKGFATTLFIFARIVFRPTLELGAGLALPTRLRTLDEPLEERFGAVFGLEAGPVFLIFDLAGFFDFLRAAIVKLSTRDRARASACTNPALFKTASGLSVNGSRHVVPGRPRTSTPRLICRLAQNRRKIKEEVEPARLATMAFG
ncbi:MAG TPA: hypothetical protein VMB83_05535 [Roseiarcus sp.]|nr:hypothetical protein [Roseiarcus sp.]